LLIAEIEVIASAVIVTEETVAAVGIIAVIDIATAVLIAIIANAVVLTDTIRAIGIITVLPGAATGRVTEIAVSIPRIVPILASVSTSAHQDIAPTAGLLPPIASTDQPMGPMDIISAERLAVG